LATESLALQLRVERSEMMIRELEAVALRLFEQRGFRDVTVEEIASEARISARTFYRYFPTKEDVLQVQIDRRSKGLRAALSARPIDEPPLHSLRLALAEQLAAEDVELQRRWIGVVAATPTVLRSVLGGIQMKSQRVIAEFFGSRLGLPSDALVPTMLAAAAGGVIQAVQIQWYFNGGDLATYDLRRLPGLGAGPHRSGPRGATDIGRAGAAARRSQADPRALNRTATHCRTTRGLLDVRPVPSTDQVRVGTRPGARVSAFIASPG
jgi:AcrR family transcriptional regulator